MKYAVIAAGEGSRLSKEGIEEPKPLVRLNGEPMIERLLRVFHSCGAEETVVMVNNLRRETGEFVRRIAAEGRYGRIQVAQKTTAGSMHSFFELSRYLSDAPFCLTTVDTVFDEEEFAGYIRAFQAGEDDGLMAVTDYVDDEKPLYVETDGEMRITAFTDADKGAARYVSGGIYCLRPGTLSALRRCMRRGDTRMRQFQRALVADGFRLRAYPFKKMLDVDHASDIAKAEAFLKKT